MAKLKLFHRLKTKEKSSIDETLRRKESEESEEQPNEPEMTEEHKNTPIKEYNETLYSKGYAQKKPTTPPLKQRQPIRRITWETAETIEQNVDSMKIKQTESTSSCRQKGLDTEKKVDFILLKKKK